MEGADSEVSEELYQQYVDCSQGPGGNSSDAIIGYSQSSICREVQLKVFAATGCNEDCVAYFDKTVAREYGCTSATTRKNCAARLGGCNLKVTIGEAAVRLHGATALAIVALAAVAGGSMLP
jgi:hypothetical protein